MNRSLLRRFQRHPALLSVMTMAAAGSLVAACASDAAPPEGLAVSVQALTAEQCDFFAVDGRVQICHRTGSTKNPFTILRINHAACLEGHVGHDGDFVTSTDPADPHYNPTCSNLGCFPFGAPNDVEHPIPCCEGMGYDDSGHCACDSDTFDNATGGTAVVELAGRAWSATAPPGAFVDPSGAQVAGGGCNIRMAVRDAGAFDGLMTLQEGGRYGGTFEPMTQADFVFTRVDDGALLQVAAGASVTIRIPAPADPDVAQADDAVQFYAYDSVAERWVYETEGVVTDAAGQLEAVASVSHFTWYGVSLSARSKSCITVTVKGPDGAPVPGLLLRATHVADGVTAYYEANSLTNEGGSICLEARASRENVVSITSGLEGTGLVAPEVEQLTLPGNSSGTCAGVGSPCQKLDIVLCADADGDGYACDDCDDTDPTVYPDAFGVCEVDTCEPQTRITQQYGSTTTDTPTRNGVAVDPAGNVYVLGYSSGSVDGAASVGSNDLVLTKWSTADNSLTRDTGWTRMWGTTASDSPAALAVDGDFVYAAGGTTGAFPGYQNLGYLQPSPNNYDRSDAFLSKVRTSDGAVVWTLQWGTAMNDLALGLAVDAAGDVYVVGSTLGSFPGFTNMDGSKAVWNSYLKRYDLVSGYDVFLTKVTPDGAIAWTRQAGSQSTPNYDAYGANHTEQGYAVAVDPQDGAVYVSGMTMGHFFGTNPSPAPNGQRMSDFYLARWSPSGELQWGTQWGGDSNDAVFSIAVDGDGDVIVAGSATPWETMRGRIYLAKWTGTRTAAPALGWSLTRVLGNEYGQSAQSLAVNGDFILAAGSYVESGTTFQTTNYDAYLMRLRDGEAAPVEEEWTLQRWGTSASDFGVAVALDPDGHPLVSGQTKGALDGQPQQSPGTTITDLFLSWFPCD